MSRNHVIEVSPNGLISLMGGKWTSFRSQGEETVDRILYENQTLKKHLTHDLGQTLNFNLVGSYSHDGKDTQFAYLNERLMKDYAITNSIATNLVKN